MTVCPNCNYERKQSDNFVSEAECPKCGIFYAKWKPVSPSGNTEALNQASGKIQDKPPEAFDAKIKRILIIALAVLVAVILINSFLIPYVTREARQETKQNNPVVVRRSAVAPEKAVNDLPGGPEQSGKTEIYVPNVAQEHPRQLSVSDIVKKNVRSVIVVKTTHGMGSGFFLNEQGHIITNKHVLSSAGNATIKTAAGNVYRISGILAEDQVGDLVIAATDTPSSEIFPVVMNGAIPEIGEKVLVIGNPLGLEMTVTDGIVSAVRTSQQSVNYIQVTAPISAGNSGCPLLNMRGEVIGVATFQYRQGQNLNFCVAADRVIALQRGVPITAANAGDQSFTTPKSLQNVYCYADNQGIVHFVDWQTGILISRPDGSLDVRKFQKWALEEAGENPNSINPEREAQAYLEENREKLFANTFPNKSSGESKL
ncbi:MAG TPA: S1C family serine protease, partial [Smithellaceae bacterium]|nr:S1C family serine protease [Smithellaceae bacterium]